VQDRQNNCVSALEVKLTALPDNTTCSREDSNFGCELVVRPDTIIYLACSLLSSLDKSVIGELFGGVAISDWNDPSIILSSLSEFHDALAGVIAAGSESQRPFLLQPVWKTTGKSPVLADHCLDV